MARVEPPLIGLARYGRERVPDIFFTRSRDRSEFLRIADRLCREFHGEVVDRHGGDGADDTEYWTIRVGESRWLLTRCFYLCGISLNSDRPADWPMFETIARFVAARPLGWRYRWLRFRRRWPPSAPLSGGQAIRSPHG